MTESNQDMTPLAREIIGMIHEAGPVSLEQFMTLAAMHPKYGYYRRHVPIGRSGDFITAPEIHQMFGELIGLWAAEVWQAMGEPSALRLVELGPGRGTLMADFLRAARVVPQFRRALDVHLVEMNEALTTEQRQRLQSFDVPLTWHPTVDDLPQGPTIVIANEFFDALPVRHYLRAADGWHERLVGLDSDGQLAFGLAPALESTITATAPLGSVLEVGLAAQRVMSELAYRLAHDGGALLVIDYGYRSKSAGETLQAVRDHAPVDPLSAPGETDLSVHVDFAALSRAAIAAGADVHGPVAQGAFLARLGIFERAATLKRTAALAQAAAVDAALARLALPGPTAGRSASMAELFQVLCITSPGLEPPGFAVPLAQVQA